MIINNNVQSLLKTYADQARKAVATDKAELATGTKKQDEFVLSSEAQSFQSLLQKAKLGSDVRAERVNEIAQQVETGQYSIEARLVAEKMLSSRY